MSAPAREDARDELGDVGVDPLRPAPREGRGGDRRLKYVSPRLTVTSVGSGVGEPRLWRAQRSRLKA
jgi:hypothetical protein